MSSFPADSEESSSEADGDVPSDETQESLDDGQEEFILNSDLGSNTKPKSRSKKQEEEEEPQYEISLEDLLVIEDEEEDIY